MKVHSTEIIELTYNVWSNCPGIHPIFHLLFLKHFISIISFGHNFSYNYQKIQCVYQKIHTVCKAATREVIAYHWDFKKKHNKNPNIGVTQQQTYTLATIIEKPQTSLIPTFCFAKQVHLQKSSNDYCNMMDSQIGSKLGAKTLYRKIEFNQVLPPSRAVHQRAGFSFEYMLWGKFCLSPTQEKSSQKRMHGSTVQEGGIVEQKMG